MKELLEVVCEGCFKKICKINNKAHEKLFDACQTYVLCRNCYIDWKDSKK